MMQARMVRGERKEQTERRGKSKQTREARASRA
jgi:hypothetical protein